MNSPMSLLIFIKIGDDRAHLLVDMKLEWLDEFLLGNEYWNERRSALQNLPYLIEFLLVLFRLVLGQREEASFKFVNLMNLSSSCSSSFLRVSTYTFFALKWGSLFLFPSLPLRLQYYTGETPWIEFIGCSS